MSVSIHPTAIVDPKAALGSDVEIGPFSIVGGDVQLGDGVRLHSHVVIEGRTSIGAGSEIFPLPRWGVRHSIRAMPVSQARWRSARTMSSANM